MTFFSNSSIFTIPLDNSEKFLSQKILEKLHSISLQKSENSDPIIKLLEDIKTRKVKIIIPSEEDTIPYLTSDISTKKSVNVPIHVKNTQFSIEKPVRFPKLFKNQRSPDFPTAKQKLLLQKLKKIPIYVVATNQNEMIMAMSRDPQENNILSWIYQKYYNSFIWTEDEGPVSLGLFFMNKEDAELYLHEIVSANPKMAEKSEIGVKIVGLDTFYRLNRTAPPGQQAKLIADLEEIEKVVQKYIPKKKHMINPKQKYNKSGYKGNPIYIIKPTIGLNKNNHIDVVNYEIKPLKSRKYIFLKLEDAYSAWDKFCDENKHLNLPGEPNLEIYNLENYLTDLEHNDEDSIKEISFISTQESFKYLKLENQVKNKVSTHSMTKQMKKFASEKLKQVQIFSKKILWVLTSDTLPTEKNAW
jgi:hypothetical protein